MFPGLHPIAMMSTAGMGFPRGAAPPSLMGSVPPYSGLYPPPITMTPQPLEVRFRLSYLSKCNYTFSLIAYLFYIKAQNTLLRPLNQSYKSVMIS